MSTTSDLQHRLARLLERQQAINDPEREPRNRLPWLPELRRWQARRLEASFEHFMDDPKLQPAASFFLTDIYNDHDFSRRDADIARVLPMMQKLLPGALLATVADAIELAVLTHAFDLRMAAVLGGLAPTRRRLDEDLYAEAYRASGLPRLRNHQIDLIVRVGEGLARALRRPGVMTLLKLSRGPARAAGLSELQAFLERGVSAFSRVERVSHFLAEIERDERELMGRLFTAEPAPFRTD